MHYPLKQCTPIRGMFLTALHTVLVRSDQAALWISLAAVVCFADTESCHLDVYLPDE